MNRGAYRLLLPLAILALSGYSISQVTNPKGFNPLQQLEKTFPDTVEIKNHGSLLEFCPDGTCDGFVTSGSVPLPTLKDFADLYTYFFSDNTTLDDWKASEGAKGMANRVLGQSKYLACKNADNREAARCVLRDLSRNGRIRLIFVRYDEGERHAIREDLEKKLAKETKP